MLRAGESARRHFLPVLLYSRSDILVQVGKLFNKPRRKTGIKGEYIIYNQHLPVTMGPRSNTDSWYLQFLGNDFGQGSRYHFQHQAKSSGLFYSQGIIDHLPGRLQVLALNFETAQLMNMGLEVVVVPTVREPDGLALSSRNVFLAPDQRLAALSLSRSLEHARQLVEAGERDAAKIRQAVIDMIAAEPLAAIDYVELYTYPDLEPIQRLEGATLLALAVKIGQTRLIDNIILEV
jgi:hypothetical protein